MRTGRFHRSQADYVIVGAGSAGCVLANRLTEDATTRVILIEAGGRDWNPLIHIPAGYMKLRDHPTLTWGFKAGADPGTNGRVINYPRGRVVATGRCCAVRQWRPAGSSVWNTARM